EDETENEQEDKDGEEQQESLNFSSIAMLEQETVTEIGNIIIGACVSKTAELLKDFVTYTPPRFIGGKFSGYDLPQKLFDKETYAIVLKTLFQFENKDISGHLFLINSVESLDWLKKAIHDYMKHYGYE
ncbi:MAG: chemotaxis protein CheC, partial [Planctomycetota bacterium]